MEFVEFVEVVECVWFVGFYVCFGGGSGLGGSVGVRVDWTLLGT